MASPTNPAATSNTGRAKIMKQGHTASTRYGSDPNVKVKGGHVVRDLSITPTKA